MLIYKDIWKLGNDICGLKENDKVSYLRGEDYEKVICLPIDSPVQGVLPVGRKHEGSGSLSLWFSNFKSKHTVGSPSNGRMSSLEENVWPS